MCTQYYRYAKQSLSYWRQNLKGAVACFEFVQSITLSEKVARCHFNQRLDISFGAQRFISCALRRPKIKRSNPEAVPLTVIKGPSLLTSQKQVSFMANMRKYSGSECKQNAVCLQFNVKKRLLSFICFRISGWFSGTRTFRSQNWTQFIHYNYRALIWFIRHYIKSPIKSPTWIWLKPLTKKTRGNTAGQHGLWPHVDPLRATQDQWECFPFFKNSRVVLQPEGEMIYVDLISPLWWQTYDQMINGQLEKQENYWRDL